MSKNAKKEGGRAGAFGQWFRGLRLGRRFCRLLGWLTCAAFTCMAVIMMCTYVIPISATLLISGLGINYESDMLSVLVLAALPSLFLVGMYFVATLRFLRFVHKIVDRAVDRICDRTGKSAPTN